MIQIGLSDIINSYKTAASSLVTSYEKDVYDSTEVDNIYKQIFKANEYQVLFSQLLAEQNNTIIQLLANQK
jgi:hypothetical protein